METMNNLNVEMARIIETTMVLHNWMIDLEPEDSGELDSDSDNESPAQAEWMHIGGDITRLSERNLVEGEQAINARNALKNYINACVQN